MTQLSSLHINKVKWLSKNEELLAGNETAQRWLKEICHFGVLPECITHTLNSLAQEQHIASLNKSKGLILFNILVIKEIFSQIDDKTPPQSFYKFIQYTEYMLMGCAYQLTLLNEEFTQQYDEKYKILNNEFGWLLEDMRLLNTLNNHSPNMQLTSARTCQLIQSIINTLTRIGTILKNIDQKNLSSTGLIHKENNIEMNLKKKFYLNNNYHKIFLTYREIQALYYSVQGKSAKQIGKILNLSPRTIECYLDKIKKKLQCQTLKELSYKVITDNVFDYLEKEYPGVIPA